jgi:hypothetical protein
VQLDQLPYAVGSPVAPVEDQNNIFAAQAAESNGISGRPGEFEVGRFRAGGNPVKVIRLLGQGDDSREQEQTGEPNDTPPWTKNTEQWPTIPGLRKKSGTRGTLAPRPRKRRDSCLLQGRRKTRIAQQHVGLAHNLALLTPLDFEGIERIDVAPGVDYEVRNGYTDRIQCRDPRLWIADPYLYLYL